MNEQLALGISRRARTRFWPLLAVVLLGAACSKGGVGAVCANDADCDPAFPCDVHGGKGTCQPPHGNDLGGNTPDLAATGSSCTKFCTCMAASCANQPGYPYPTPAACLTSCAAFTEQEKTCWSSGCGTAETAITNKQHLCEHAWGQYGLDEC